MTAAKRTAPLVSAITSLNRKKFCELACSTMRGMAVTSGISTTVESDGTSTLTEVRIHDERRGHVLILQPEL